MASTSGTEADKYEVLEKIGHGSFGVIRKVKRKSDGKIVCRKEINYVKMTAREREQLAAEFNILHSLSHDNIVAYYHRDHLRDQQEVHLYMEYCGGGDLSTKIKEFRRNNQHPSEEYVWDVIGQLSSALYRCHEGELAPAVKGNILGPPVSPKKLKSKTSVMILHRDLKPENIFLGDDDSVKLGDFGLSKAISQHDLASTYVGTPYYMSPEICASEKYGWHSDIWAMGCIIYELCSGRPPFDAKTHLHLMQKIKDGRTAPLPDVYSKELKALVNSCLQINPNHRPRTGDIINMPIVRIMRKGREMVAVSKLLETQKIDVARKLSEANAKNAELQSLVVKAENERQALVETIRKETLDNLRSEIDASLRREWEVKAQLEISKHCQRESDRLQGLFDVELDKRVAAEVAAQINAYKRSEAKSSGLDTPPLSDLSKLSFESPLVEKLTGPSVKKPTRTPFTRAQTQVTTAVDSPMDVHMASPSPMCNSLALSPRRAAAMAGIPIPHASASSLFANPNAKDRWQPQLAYQSESEHEEDEDEMPELPSPTVPKSRTVGIPLGGDPFKSVNPIARPGFRRQVTVPINTALAQPSIFGDKANASTTSFLPTPTSPTRRPKGLLAKAVTTAAGVAPTGRTLVELNHARVANLSNIPISRPTSANNLYSSSQEHCQPSNKQVAVWDPEVEIDMPSPFLARKGRGMIA